jgi:hypothetical protein
MRRLSKLAGPALLLIICIGFYWRLVFTNQFTWINSPDMVNQEATRFQFQSVCWRSGTLPLWDPYLWCGQPFLAAVVGAANPVNWPFFLLPHDSAGKMPLSELHWYFVFIHYLGGLFAYWLCRDLRLSRTASLFGALVFALSGFFGTNTWVGIMGGFLWIPLVFLFLLRTLRGDRDIPSAALCGLFWGMSWLGGHHEVPIYLSTALGAIWIYAICAAPAPGRRRLILLAALCVLIAAFTSGLQTIPGFEYAQQAQRWVGTDHALSWNEPIPYSVDASMSYRPGSVTGTLIPWLANDATGYLGFAGALLAAFGVIACWKERWVPLFTAVALFGVLFAMGSYNIFHGIFYAAMPLFGKTRSPGRLLSMFDFGAAPLAAYGMDALLLRRAPLALRRITRGLAATGAGIFAIVLAVALAGRYAPYQTVLIAAFAALLLAGLLYAWQRAALAPRPFALALLALMLGEFGFVTGAFGDRGPAARFSLYADIARFLKQQPGPIRVDLDDIFNFGDWEGIDTLRGFGAGVTANFLRLQWWEPRTRDLLGVTFEIAKPESRPGETPVFKGSSGYSVYRNATAFPRVWSVHRAMNLETDLRVRAALGDPKFDLRVTAPMTEPAPALETCNQPDAVAETARGMNTVRIGAHMACRGLVVLSETWYPGWQATVDGRPTRIYQTYQALRGVVVPAGNHTIVMRFRPRSVLIGALMTAAGIIAACALALKAAK